jgi:ABC-type phosphate transport system auxiliary subunit
MGSVSISVNPVVVIGVLLALSVTGLLWWLYAYFRWRMHVYVAQQRQQQQQHYRVSDDEDDEEELPPPPPRSAVSRRRARRE